MSAPRYLGLTWDHPRGYQALDAAAAQVAPGHGLSIHWQRHPLEGFESHPIVDLAANYDLIVLDHPHIGEALAGECLRPMEDILGAEDVAALTRDTIGPSMASYGYGGAHWALPLDAASQVMAFTPGAVEDVPRTWDEVLALAGKLRVALSLSGPHAALTFQSIAAAFQGRSRPNDRFVTPEAGREAYAIMQALTTQTTREHAGHNPITLLEALAAGDDLALVPLVYGYVNYASSGRVRFADAPRGPAGIGSILGGTGIAVSRRAPVTEALCRHLRWLMSSETQCRFIPANAGQPALHVAWSDSACDAAAGNFYSATRATLENAALRPRHDGAIALQTEIARRLREGLLLGEGSGPVLDAIEAAYARHHEKGTRT
ncbi:extracellular solute-binding protein [Novosphingobium sp. BW1]|uniref:extracellular solute-binding protein n=1 Tax=Novosphingobium sp. BW1 TaxID=2592621 RepID=UPI0011DED7EF|nr:extracellular solute-binding protein [Novosphingobium sp. BW1]TYC90448.1 extracellular solute-binding protein [Novosphingobium sp. BW1]